MILLKKSPRYSLKKFSINFSKISSQIFQSFFSFSCRSSSSSSNDLYRYYFSIISKQFFIEILTSIIFFLKISLDFFGKILDLISLKGFSEKSPRVFCRSCGSYSLKELLEVQKCFASTYREIFGGDFCWDPLNELLKDF